MKKWILATFVAIILSVTIYWLNCSDNAEEIRTKDSRTTFMAESTTDNQIVSEQRYKNFEKKEKELEPLLVNHANTIIAEGDSSLAELEKSVYCEGIPLDETEISDWIATLDDTSNINAEAMRNEVEACSGTVRLTFEEKEQILRNLIDQEQDAAKLSFAKMIPYDSPEKLRLLREVSEWSEEAQELLAESGMTSKYMSHIEKAFWISVSSRFSLNYADEKEIILNEILFQLDNEQIGELELIVASWKAPENRPSIVRNFSLYFAN